MIATSYMSKGTDTGKSCQKKGSANQGKDQDNSSNSSCRNLEVNRIILVLQMSLSV